MKLLKLDPMTFLILVVALGVVLTMTTQAGDRSSTMALQAQDSQAQVSQARLQTAKANFKK